MFRNVFILLLVIVLCLSMNACKKNVIEQPDSSTNQMENTEQTGNAENPQNDSWNPGLSLFRFLEDTNSNGQLAPTEEQVAPGDLPEMWRIPQPDQSRIGETVSIVLAKWHQAIPFYYSCAENGTERLVVFLSAEKIPMLMAFETQLGGIAELCKKISTGAEFQGKILAMVNISWEEGNIYAPNVGSSTYQVAAEEFLTESTALVAGECVGIIGRANDKDNTVLTVVKGGVYQTASQGLRSNIDWMKQKFTRCGINELF